MPAKQMNKLLENLPQAQRVRLEFIDFCLQYHGFIGRGELMKQFGTKVASCTRDLTLYRELTPSNLAFYHEDKRYYRTNEFQSLFQHNSNASLQALAEGFGEDVPDLISPPQDILAVLSRAISQGKATELAYMSLSSGQSTREFIPHAIINNGQRWHVRGFCRKRREFRDFVCTRITAIHSNSTQVAAHEQQTADAEWNTLLHLKLVPHPSHKHPNAIALDFNMPLEHNQPVRRLTIRAARVGYLLRHWNVDCSTDHHLPAHEYHLWLSNHSILDTCANASLAPGFNQSQRNL